MSDNPNSPAMPIIDEHSRYEVDVYHGLTKREHFIAMAMQGLCAKVDLTEYAVIDIAYDAVKIADETMKVMEAE